MAAETPRALHLVERVHQVFYLGFRARALVDGAHDRAVHLHVTAVAIEHDVAERRALRQPLVQRASFFGSAPHRVDAFFDLEKRNARLHVLVRFGGFGHLQRQGAGTFEHAAQRHGRVHRAVAGLRRFHVLGHAARRAPAAAQPHDAQQHGPATGVVIQQLQHGRFHATLALGGVHGFALHALGHVAHGGIVDGIKRVVVVHVLLVDLQIVGHQRIELVV